MNKKEVKNLNGGLYRIWWKEGGSSLAAIGICENGDKWIAPINWVLPSDEQKVWKAVRKITPLYLRKHTNIKGYKSNGKLR